MKSVGYAEALSSRPKPGGKKMLRSIEIEPAMNGGHVVNHRFHSGNGPYHEPEQHVFGADDGEKLMAHLKTHLGIKAGTAAAKAEEKAEGDD
jgi:hypothetical protein